MIDINVYMEDFIQKLINVFANRVWFIGLQGSYGREEAINHTRFAKTLINFWIKSSI